MKLKNILKGYLEQNAFPIYFYVYRISMNFRMKNSIKKNLSKNHNLKPLWDLDLSVHKKSDTIFILGSGASINKLNDFEWDIINKHDSIGLNFWPVHDHVPTYYAFEFPREKERADIFKRLISIKAIEYQNIPVVFKDINLDLPLTKELPVDKFNEFYISPDFLIPGESMDTFDKALKKIRDWDIIKNPTNVIHLVPKKRASLSYAIFFSIVAGYKNIVLCGVDLNNTSYFYEENADYYLKKGIPFPESVQSGNIHKTIDPTYGEMTIDKIIYSINDIVLKPMGLNLYISSEDSALYPSLPLFDLKNNV